MKKITVFTPTYNRAYCLNKCYESLLKQTNKDFVWLLIDDGSSDNTKELVAQWQKENKISIQYHFQENQGMHGAHNTAYSLIETELNVCIDSDDYMPEDAIENILNYWNSIDNKNELAGIIGLDAYENNTIIGTKFPDNITNATLEDLYFKYHCKGDKKLVYRTEIIKKFQQYPIYKGERFVPLGTLYLLVDKKYKLACLNEVLCIVEYMEDGSSRNIVKQYFRHPKGFQYARMLNMKYSNYLKVRFKNAVHYVSHSLQLKDSSFLTKTPNKMLTIAAIPFGCLLYGYVFYFNRIKK
ncbi:glycosyltransferase family 2 protein [Galbibacter mesophilus]|uniref:glycosyltransferase family 2 protein n=1 Tax=Galbibacter mesophilus TaxID=379069 RepID=UPI00191E1907|nr:glycosyltransferase family A protein [Galbibacter mesophilus]MCM5663420.1 glycosyltransferase family 2 protein [Galbibacter mesophilus]